MPVITNIEDLRVLAEARVPRMFYDYADAGSWTESTYRANEADFQRIKLRQRVAVDMDEPLAAHEDGRHRRRPCRWRSRRPACTGMQHADGEILAARAAEKFGVPFTLSMMSICSIEDVAAHTKAPFWFQPYMLRDRAFMERLIERAQGRELQRAGADARPADPRPAPQGHQERPHRAAQADARQPPQPGDQAALVPRHARHQAAQLRQHRRPRRAASATCRRSAPGPRSSSIRRLSWADVEWVKKLWGGKLILKGILDVEDARLAVASGADAIVVSNHGGRQLDGAPSSISALPAIADAVGSQIEVWMDGGIRSGQDVLKAWALGARGTLIGRAFLYGLGAMGEAGVTRCLEIIAKRARPHDGVLRPHRHPHGRSARTAAWHLSRATSRRSLRR